MPYDRIGGLLTGMEAYFWMVGKIKNIAVRCIPGRSHLESLRLGNAGLTLLEVIVVMVIMTVLAAYAVTTMGVDSAELMTRAEALKSHIRYSQALSMNTDEAYWGIRFDRGSALYWLFNCDDQNTCNWASNRTLLYGTEPNANNQIDLAQHSISIQSIRSGGNIGNTAVTLVFDNYGKPYFWSGTGGLNLDTPLSDTAGLTEIRNQMRINLRDAGNNRTQLLVTGETGYVP